jgi:DNA-binding CsgD family transcriptional regulator
MTKSEEKKFYEYLAVFQPDIRKLIGSKRREGHLMSVDEIASDFNFNLIKKKEKVTDYRDERFPEFSFESFKFVICSFIKNAVGWYQCRKTEEKFFCRRVNNQVQTEEGPKSSFEILEQTEGIESDFNFDDNSKHTYFLKLIKNYADHLTRNEVELLHYTLKGYKQTKIAEIMGVTHQAISFNFIRLEEKLRCRVKENFLKDESWSKIPKGKKAIQDLFGCEKS